ncbi:winged helix-turn-helix transcriptional regulator [Komagataeibacter xylinus]|uniref:Winged helix-turn-helix transcriptional regulator n=1 Tax=Komagataeibacter xylinus TaxID=28448 RepID=A0A857FUW7_KOMXY|nr:winged helix-turn-helix transcriptional regulator [Komagataeibacter xylinus]
MRRGKTWKRANPRDPSFSSETSPFFYLTRLVGLYHLRMDAYLKPIKMDVPRWRVLNILFEHEFATISQIADLAVTRVSTMTKLIYRMEGESLLTTAISASDGRVVEVRLAPKGLQALEQVRSKAAMVFERAFGDIPDSEIKYLQEICKKVYGNLEF